jgi:hypothetical protein
MDPLDRVAAPGRDLLTRVDAVLTAGGAPADHAIWPLMRRLGALPGDVLEAFCALRPAPLLAAGTALRQRAEGYCEERADLSAAVAATLWEGDAATEFGGRWRVLGEHLGDHAAPEAASLAGRLAATGSYVDDVAEWVRVARLDLAHTVAGALGSAEAVRLRGAGSDGAAVPAAATIGALVLATGNRQVDAAEAVADRWAGRLADLPFRPASEPAGRSGVPTRVAL